MNTFALFRFWNLFCFIQPVALWTGAYDAWMVLFIMQYWSCLHLRRCENYSEAQNNIYLMPFHYRKLIKIQIWIDFAGEIAFPFLLGKMGTLFFMFLCKWLLNCITSVHSRAVHQLFQFFKNRSATKLLLSIILFNMNS